jgi:predicted flap endonuclease-1-like 5' DNA nuclease
MNINNTQGSPEGVYTPEPRVYELGYLLMPSVNEGNLSNERDALVALITKFKGIVISEGQPQLIDLAYDMTKVIDNKKHTYSQAYFGWIKFDVTPDVVEALTDEVEIRENLLRSIMAKTERENLLTTDQPYRVARINELDETEEDIDVSSEEVTEKTATDEEKETSSDASDDLTKIEGIGPKIAEIFAANGVKTFEDLSGSKVGDLRTLLADNELTGHEPKTWSKQATLAKHGKWDELKELQDELNGGK